MKNIYNFPLMAPNSDNEGSAKAPYPTVSPEKFKEVVGRPGIFILDVRGADEYKEAHIEGAFNLDVTQPDFEAKAKNMLLADKMIAVYCRSGKRSAMASDILSRDGYKIVNLDGGITNWEEKGEPTVQS